MKLEFKEQPVVQLAEFEKRINEIPLVINPCKMCKVYKKKDGYKTKGYDIGHFDSNGDWVEGDCKICCWYYDSKFKMNK